MRRILVLLVSALFLPALAVVATALPANAAAPSATAAGVKGTYEFSFVPNNGSPGDSYPWILKKHHVLDGDGFYYGNWIYFPHKGIFTAKYTSEEGPAAAPICTFKATGSPKAGFSGSYDCPTGTSGSFTLTKK